MLCLTPRHASRGSQTLRGLLWSPEFSSDLGEGAVGSGETLGGSEARGPSSATRGGTPSTRSAGVGCHVCKTSCPAALGGFLILQGSLGLSNIGRSQKCVISGSPADSVVKNLPVNARATGSIQKDPARRGAAKCTHHDYCSCRARSHSP